MKAIPDWVPAVVRHETERMVKDFPELASHAEKLLTDPRMKSVWRELHRQQPLPGALAEPDHFAPEWRDTLTDTRDIGIVLFVRRVLLWASGPIPINTRTKLVRQISAFQQQAQRLRDEADAMRKHEEVLDNDERAEHIGNLERAAAWCEKEAIFIIEMDPTDPNAPIVERDYGGLRALELVNSLVAVAERLYGTPLRGTVAILVNVILEPTIEVTDSKVRDWMDRLRGM